MERAGGNCKLTNLNCCDFYFLIIYYVKGPNCRTGYLQKQVSDWIVCLDCVFCLGIFSCCFGINKKKCTNCGYKASSDNC
jgi:hypothetical protein